MPLQARTVNFDNRSHGKRIFDLNVPERPSYSFLCLIRTRSAAQRVELRLS